MHPWLIVKRIALFFITVSSFSTGYSQLEVAALSSDIRSIFRPDVGICQQVVHDPRLYKEGWQTLSQAKFWRKVMNTSPDSIVVNVGETRQILRVVSAGYYNGMTYHSRNAFHQSLLKENNLPLATEIMATKGRSDFYRVDKVVPKIDGVIDVFVKEGVDPWLAQAILLIESPAGHNLRSYSGAYGPFQLMPDVARHWGLVVNEKVDERSNLAKSAKAAAKLIKYVCIPEAEKILASHKIAYDKDEIWFRLLVLHVYHAGSGNVRAVMARIQPKSGGPDLMRSIWTTEAAAFRNESQNYSQIALAGMMEMDAFIYRNCQRGCPKPAAPATAVPTASAKR